MGNLWQDLIEPEMNLSEFDELFSKMIMKKKSEKEKKPNKESKQVRNTRFKPRNCRHVCHGRLISETCDHFYYILGC